MLAALGVLGAGAALNGCTSSTPVRVVQPDSPQVAALERERVSAGTGRTVRATLTAAPGQVDLGGTVVSTWLYDGTLPGPLLRADRGDELDVTFVNRLPEASSVHWHGIALRNDMDGVPGLTQPMVDAGHRFRYRFTVPDAGSYWAHSHSGMQLDRGLYLPLVVADPHEPAEQDVEHVVVLDDWLDGTGTTPDAVLARLSGGHPVPMPGMDSMTTVTAAQRAAAAPWVRMSYSRTSPWGPILGDVGHRLFLANGKLATDPVRLTARPGQRVRLRLINAGSDTVFRVRVAGHRLTVRAADGWAVAPVVVDELLIAMGERYDVELTAGSGRFALDADAEGKNGRARAVLATSPARGAVAVARPGGRALRYTDLRPVAAARLAARAPDRQLTVHLAQSDTGFVWTMNGRTWAHRKPLDVHAGERVRLTFVNDSEMYHPMHLHGHTWALVGAGAATAGARKDVTVVRPGTSLHVDVQADNPGRWAMHCHNLYHGQAGMMTELRYLR